LKILSIIGSLRKESFSRKIALAAESHAPDGILFERTNASQVALYDEDLDTEDKPAGVRDFLEAIESADALLFVLPEYNYGIPGPLKNAIDWASRPAFRSPLRGKPSLIIACSMAPTGGARAYAQLSTVLGGTLTPVYLMPSFLIPTVHEKFDASGALIDETTRSRLTRTLDDFCTFAAAH
jgi:chromate reductase